MKNLLENLVKNLVRNNMRNNMKKNMKKSLLQGLVAGSGLVLALGFSINAFADLGGNAQVALEKAKKDILHFRIIENAKVYSGGRPEPQDLRTLKELGVKTVINLQGGDYDLFGDAAAYFEAGESYAVIRQERTTAINLKIGWYPFRLSTFAPVGTAEQADIKKILEILSDKTMQPVFFHCEFGQDRSGLIAALYEVFFLNESVENAHARWVAFGHSGQLAQYATTGLDQYFYSATAHLH